MRGIEESIDNPYEEFCCKEEQERGSGWGFRAVKRRLVGWLVFE